MCLCLLAACSLSKKENFFITSQNFVSFLICVIYELDSMNLCSNSTLCLKLLLNTVSRQFFALC